MGNLKLSLLATQKSGLPSSVYKYEPAHASRYLITARLINQIGKTSKVKSKVLDVGGKKGLLRQFGVQSTILDQENSDEPNYIKADAIDMPFPDESFDITVSCDVLEHIPKNNRERFIDEMVRVSKGYVIIGAPFNQKGVGDSEKSANKFYKNISGNDHRWLIEHIENGLPDEESILEYIKKKGLNYKTFRHLSLDVWQQTTHIHFLSAVFGDNENIKNLTKKTYKNYYDNLCELDYSEKGYRTFVIINKKDSFELELPEPLVQLKAKEHYKSFLSEQMLSCIKGQNQERRELVENFAKQSTKLSDTENRLRDMTEELKAIKESKSWKLANKVSKARNFYK